MTAANPDAAAALDAAVTAYLGLRTDPGDHLKAALAADPELILGHVLRGYFLLLFANRELAARARRSLDAALAAGRDRANPRESLHIAALEAWCGGDAAGALARWNAILIDYPRDAAALKLAEYWHLYSGDGAGLRGNVARVLHAWDEAVPGFGFVLGMQAFGLEECGAVDEAETLGRRAVERNPADVWAAHAVTHVLETTGRQREGGAWIDGLASHWGAVNHFVRHVWWHRALFQLELGAFDAALDLYDREIRRESTSEYLDIANAASLLWRLESEGVESGDRWSELAARSAERIDHMLVFADAHYVLALASSDEPSAARALGVALESAARYAGAGGETQAAVMRDCGLALCDAIVASRRGDFGRAADLLYPLRRALRRIGGSHAQRDLFEQMLIHAAIAADRPAMARALLSERVRLRPRSGLSWRRYAGVLGALGDAEGAAAAEATAGGLLASRPETERRGGDSA